jgi:hypothetical protein
MDGSPARGGLLLVLSAGAALGWAGAAFGQSIEPRAYSPAPTGVNFLIAGFGATRGGLTFDSIPLTDAHLRSYGPIVAYARTFGLFGRSAKLDVIAPYAELSGSAVYRGTPVSRAVSGWGDPLARLSINLVGGPAMDAAEFRRHRPDFVAGASLQVGAPLGQYDPQKVLNLSAHRWSFKPELGVSKAFSRWTIEWQLGATFFTANDDFFGGNRRTQRPLYSSQAHAIYNFSPGTWAALDATFFTGGRSQLNGELNNDLQRNWRVGATLALPIDARNSVKLSASRGVSARTGNSFDAVGVALQHRWGGGF